MALGNLMGGHIGNALGQNVLGSLQGYGQYQNNPNVYGTKLPEGWGFTEYNSTAVPLTFLAKLRHEIKEWHGNPLEINH